MKGQKKLHHILLWKFLEVFLELFFEVPLSGCSKSTLFKFDANKELELLQLILYK